MMLHFYCILLLTCFVPVKALAADEGRWLAQPSMRNARAAHAVVSTKEAIYAMAGTGAGNKPVLEVEKFDGKQWSAETPLPGSGLNAPAATVLKDRIYLIGGFNTTTNIPSQGVLVYDIGTRKWSEAAPLPAPRGGHAAVEFQGRSMS
ncbi:MAG: kelch repeat-containing protein [Gemmatales bacterium]